MKKFAFTALICAALLASPAAQADSTPNTFKTKCSLVGSGQFDPIVHPGENPVGHTHEFFGSTAITPDATGNTLQAAGDGADSCADAHDTAGYWVPRLFADGKAVTPTGIDAYYERMPNLLLSDGTSADSVLVPPTDFRMVAGNSAATGPQPRSVVKWACSDNSIVGVLPPACPDKPLTVHIVFPSCWNGSFELKANNTEDVRYPVNAGGTSACPPGFDEPITRVALTVHYAFQPDQPACSDATTDGCVTYNVSAENPDDPTGPPVLGSPYAMHADWLNGWQTNSSLGFADPASFDGLIASCDNGPDGTPACGVVGTRPPGSAFVPFS